jgi:ribosomal protein S18 acetylase RimI-like enzyme
MLMRRATLRDLDPLLALEEACYPPNQAYTREEYRYALAKARSVNLVHDDAGPITGFVGAFHHRLWRIGHVYTVNVHPHERGKGLGVRLMEACHAELRALGMTRCVLEVNVENDPAMRLYERCGYTRQQRLEDYYTQYRVNDAWRYVKELEGRGTTTDGMDAPGRAQRADHDA